MVGVERTTAIGVHHELTTELIAREVMRRGHTPRWVRGALFVVEVEGVVYGWNMSRCTVSSTIGAELTTRKDYTRKLLRDRGVSVAAGGSFRAGDQHAGLQKALQLGWPVVVKPAGRRAGLGVTVGVDSEQAFRDAWRVACDAAAGARAVVVERQASGTEARFLTVGGRCVAIAGRVPAHVVGDGRSTVRELVDAKNAERQRNPHLRRHLIPLTGDPDRVPADAEHVGLDRRGGFSTGADSIDLTDAAHMSYLQVAAQAETAFPQLGLAGIDIIAEDITAPATPDNHIVVEVNARPAIGAHHYPWFGHPQDVAAAIVDECLGIETIELDEDDPDPEVDFTDPG